MENIKCSCGCVTCRGIKVPDSHWGWKGLTNKHGRGYGMHAKGHGVKQQHRK